MKKFLAGFFLPLCIFLLSGYGPSYAFAYRSVTAKSLGRLASSHVVPEDSQEIVILSPSSGKENFRMDVTEIQENEEEKFESNSSKKYFESNHFLSSILSNPLAYFAGFNKTTLQLSKHLSDHLSHKWYLIFGIIRI